MLFLTPEVHRLCTTEKIPGKWEKSYPEKQRAPFTELASMALQYQLSTANCAEVVKTPITLPQCLSCSLQMPREKKKGRLGLLLIKLKICHKGNVKGEKTQSVGKALTEEQ